MKDKNKEKVEIIIRAYRHFLAPIIVIKTAKKSKKNKSN